MTATTQDKKTLPDGKKTVAKLPTEAPMSPKSAHNAAKEAAAAAAATTTAPAAAAAAPVASVQVSNQCLFVHWSIRPSSQRYALNSTSKPRTHYAYAPEPAHACQAPRSLGDRPHPRIGPRRRL